MRKITVTVSLKKLFGYYASIAKKGVMQGGCSPEEAISNLIAGHADTFELTAKDVERVITEGSREHFLRMIKVLKSRGVKLEIKMIAEYRICTETT